MRREVRKPHWEQAGKRINAQDRKLLADHAELCGKAAAGLMREVRQSKYRDWIAVVVWCVAMAGALVVAVWMGLVVG